MPWPEEEEEQKQENYRAGYSTGWQDAMSHTDRHQDDDDDRHDDDDDNT